MRISKKAIVFIMVLSSIFSIGCIADNSGNDPKILKIGVAIYRADDTFISYMVKCMEFYAGKLSDDKGVIINLTIEDAKRNQSTQNKQIENFIARGYDIICVNPVDRTMANFIINKAEKANVPLIFFNREPVESDMTLWNRVYYVGADARQSGEMMGRLVIDEYWKNPGIDKNKDGRLQYVMLEGEPTHQDSLLRTDESIKIISSKGIGLDKLASDAAEWERGIASAKMLNWIDQFGYDIELVMANNDDMALGALDALTERDMLEDGPKVVGIDGTDVALQAITAGHLLGAVVNDGYGQAKGILDLAYTLLTGGDAPDDKYVMIPYYTVWPKQVDKEIEARKNIDGSASK